MQSRSWSHLVRVKKLDGSRVNIYCTAESGLLRAAGDVDTAPGQRVAARNRGKWECLLSWAHPECKVERRREGDTEEQSALIVWRREDAVAEFPARCLPYRVVFTAESADVNPAPFEKLVALHGNPPSSIITPASGLPYRRMASLTPEERTAYWSLEGA